ncbi:MAG: hypothetical protein K2J80_03870 [Oscillospiraceae bacterium]|nr:hypothetical protein [Oscillospiraceae bacterium]
MSLNSFDKFCEKIINGEPIDNKDIFDERQERVRTKSLVIALTNFGSLCAANTLFMECGMRWSESYFMPMAVFMAVCYLGFLLQNARRGSLFGINGTSKATMTASFLLAQGIVMLFFKLIDKKDPFCVIKNGRVSEIFLMVLFFMLEIVCAAITFVLAHKFNKSKKDENEP